MKTPTETLKQSTATERVLQSSFLYEPLEVRMYRRETSKVSLFGHLAALGK